MNTYEKIKRFLNQSSINYIRNVFNTHENITFDSNVSNRYFMASINYKPNSKCVITDIIFDIETSKGLDRIEKRLSFKELITEIGIIKYD